MPTVHVVDNDSRDGTPQFIRERFPSVKIIEAGANIGFGAANNLAFRLASRAMFSLNPDTRLAPSVLERLIEVMEEQPQVGICGCRLELKDGSFDHAAKRSFPTPLGALGHFTRIGRLGSSPGWLSQYRAPAIQSGEVDAVNGAFMPIGEVRLRRWASLTRGTGCTWKTSTSAIGFASLVGRPGMSRVLRSST